MSGSRPPVDVVVPFKGGRSQLDDVAARLGRLELRDGDSLLIVDNTPGDPRDGTLHAPEVQTPGYARNRGSERGAADWLVFLDADVVPRPDLLDRYFDPTPRARTAVIAGGVIDEAVPPGAPAASRYAHLRGLMSQENTFSWLDWSFAQTSNAAFRREAFEAVGGFREDIRAAEDADLTYRLKAAGWEVERREEASAEHLSRPSLRQFVAQRSLHGAGGAWLDREYPGAVPRRKRPGLLWWAARFSVKGLLRAARERDRDKAILAVFDPLELISYEFGRSLRNQRRRP